MFATCNYQLQNREDTSYKNSSSLVTYVVPQSLLRKRSYRVESLHRDTTTRVANPHPASLGS